MDVYLSKKNRIRVRRFFPFNDAIEKLPSGACSICSFRSNNFRQIEFLSRIERNGRNSGRVKNIEASWKRFSYSLYHFIEILVGLKLLVDRRGTKDSTISTTIHHGSPRSFRSFVVIGRVRGWIYCVGQHGKNLTTDLHSLTSSRLL